VVPVAVFLGAVWGGPERSLLVLGPLSTFALPVIAMIAFWWEDWPGTIVRPPLTGLVDTVSDGWPLRGLNRVAGGVASLAASWAVAVAIYQVFVAGDGPVTSGQFGAALVCIGVLQVAFYVVLRGWPFSLMRSRASRLGLANEALIAGGLLINLALAQAADLAPATISAVAGAAVAAGLVVRMLFDAGWTRCCPRGAPARQTRQASRSSPRSSTSACWPSLTRSAGRAWSRRSGWRTSASTRSARG
jgi:hypothetical protein